MPNNDSLKHRIHAGEVVVGVSASLDSDRSHLEAILSKDTYSFLTIDSQHSPYNEEKLVAFCATAQGPWSAGSVPHQEHPPRLSHWERPRPGTLGYRSPLVEDEAVVDEALDSFYYPQVGHRSWGGAARHGIGGREDRLTYAKWWNEHGILCLQMETLAAVTNARRLAKPGVDCLTWGPADLSFDMEAHPQHPFQTVDDCLRHVLRQLEGTNVRISFRNGAPDQRQKYIDMGITVFMERPQI